MTCSRQRTAVPIRKPSRTWELFEESIVQQPTNPPPGHMIQDEPVENLGKTCTGVYITISIIILLLDLPAEG